MKLRFHRNSLRLRLSPADVAALAATGRVVAEIAFDAQARFQYEVRVSDAASTMTASYIDGAVRIDVPAALAAQFVGTPQVGIESIQSASSGLVLKIVVEKDFECLHPEHNEPGETFYPHPRKRG